MKKIALGGLCAIAVACIVCVYNIGGQLGACAWNLAVFIIAPLAATATLVQIIILIFAFVKKQKTVWKTLFIAISFVLALPLTVLLGISPIVYPTSADISGAVTMEMPVEGAVLFGGKEYKTHAMWPSECYAYDILKEPYDVGSENLEAYGIFGCDVIAPISGTVVAFQNNEPDIIPNTELFSSSLGNYISIEIADTGTYLILAHLKENSVAVQTGDTIEQGEIIGKVGNSGTTSEPHLHIQHQRNNPLETAFPICAEGLPIIFNE